MTHHSDDGGSKNVWNVSILVRDYMEQYPRRLSSSWELEVSVRKVLPCDKTLLNESTCDVAVNFHSFQILALNSGDWSAWIYGRLSPVEFAPGTTFNKYWVCTEQVWTQWRCVKFLP
jgi:hypothetical protein